MVSNICLSTVEFKMDTQGDECLPSVHTQPNIHVILRGFHQQCWHRDNKWEVKHNLPRGWLYNPLTSSSWQISVSLLLRAPLTSATSLSSSEQWSCAPSSSWMATLAVSSCCMSCLTRCCEEDCTSSRSRRVLSREAFRDVASDSNCMWVWRVFVWGVCVCGMWCVWCVVHMWTEDGLLTVEFNVEDVLGSPHLSHTQFPKFNTELS